ncbi:hypothetical protein ETQ85_24775 [Zoogloea oleivorans]|uniref:Chemoreceptor zinc-binding domain-containing protein n=1 Tax=Zoogloea oleivorans TaxID=1552750 RepID=A0A6C2CBT0_9RHOO|nr:CZB domain-containing protein [Zoogloea oleivorans]TYC50939.1 hypothetical protein ETQ85_24775 [Zoogloea oleivorans]
MNLDIIDNAIQRHLRWVAEFNAALAGTGPRDFDLEIASDETACALGQWFSSPESSDLLGEDFHSRAIALHGAFHEISAEVVASFRAQDPSEVTQALIAALEDLSKSLIEFLEFAKKRLIGAPPSWLP